MNRASKIECGGIPHSEQPNCCAFLADYHWSIVETSAFRFSQLSATLIDNNVTAFISSDLFVLYSFFYYGRFIIIDHPSI